MPSASVRTVCVSCRAVTQSTDAHTACAGPVLQVDARWRAPRRGNDVAWARVGAGELLWDRRAVGRAERRAAQRRAANVARRRAVQRTAEQLGISPAQAAQARRAQSQGLASPEQASLLRRWDDAIAAHLERTAHRP